LRPVIFPYDAAMVEQMYRTPHSNLACTPKLADAMASNYTTRSCKYVRGIRAEVGMQNDLEHGEWVPEVDEPPQEDEPAPGLVEFEVAFQGLDTAVAEFANHFSIQRQNDEVQFVIGQLMPPILLGDREDRIRQAKETVVPIRVLGRYILTAQRLGELAGLVNRIFAQIQQEAINDSVQSSTEKSTTLIEGVQ
jgi:hypothetical protein